MTRDKSWLPKRAFDAYLANQFWRTQIINDGLADAEAGRLVPHDKVRSWLLTWGKPNELEPPA